MSPDPTETLMAAILQFVVISAEAANLSAAVSRDASHRLAANLSSFWSARLEHGRRLTTTALTQLRNTVRIHIGLLRKADVEGGAALLGRVPNLTGVVG